MPLTMAGATLLSPVISGAMGLLGGAFSQSTPSYQEQIRAQMEAQRSLFDYQFEKQSPLNMMNRLKAAGLHPATYFGNGSMPTYTMPSAPSGDPTAKVKSNEIAMQALERGVAMSNLIQQNKNLKVQNRLGNAQAKSQELDNQIKQQDVVNKSIQAQGLNELYIHHAADGSIELGYMMPSGEFAPQYDSEGRYIGNGDLQSYPYYRAVQTALKEGLGVAADWVNYKLDDIERVIKEKYGETTAAKVIAQLEADIADKLSGADYKSEQAKSVKLDNDMFDNLGFGSKIADGIVRLLVGILMKR